MIPLRECHSGQCALADDDKEGPRSAAIRDNSTGHVPVERCPGDTERLADLRHAPIPIRGQRPQLPHLLITESPPATPPASCSRSCQTSHRPLPYEVAIKLRERHRRSGRRACPHSLTCPAAPGGFESA